MCLYGVKCDMLPTQSNILISCIPKQYEQHFPPIPQSENHMRVTQAVMIHDIIGKPKIVLDQLREGLAATTRYYLKEYLLAGSQETL